MADLEQFFSENSAIVELRLARVHGSSPREAGAIMYVSKDAQTGTIGGGQLEYMALDEARKLLAAGRDRAVMDVPLGPEIGQCCGGRVEIALARLDPTARARALDREKAELAARPQVLIFGAGHIGRALARALAPLPVRARLIDSRQGELAQAQAREPCLTVLPEAELRAAPAGSAYIILTHDHALDFLLAGEALAQGDAAYVGMIGSATKRARFDRWLRKTTQGQDATRLTCPMAPTCRDKRPEVIAAFIVTEVMAALADHQTIHKHTELTA